MILKVNLKQRKKKKEKKGKKWIILKVNDI